MEASLSRVAGWGAVLLVALTLPCSAAADETDSSKSAVAGATCSEGTDGKIEYRARYLKADWVVSERPAEPDLVVTVMGRISNKGSTPLEIPHPARAFHQGVQIQFPDKSSAAGQVPVFLPPEETPATLQLKPGEAFMFLQGSVARTPEVKAHPLLDKKVRVTAQVSAPPGAENQWSGCVTAKIGDITIPSADTSERYHANEKLADFAARMRKEARLQ